MIIFFCWSKLSPILPVTFLYHSLNIFLISWCLRKYNILGSSCIFPVPGWSQSSLQGVLAPFNVKWHLETMIWALGLFIPIRFVHHYSKAGPFNGLIWNTCVRARAHTHTHTHTHTLCHLYFYPTLDSLCRLYFYLNLPICMYICKCLCVWARETERKKGREKDGERERGSTMISHQYIHLLSNTIGFTLVFSFSICNSLL